MALTDSFQRPLRDLRISVTDRCNFRCVYCMPKELFGPDFAFLPHKDLLTFEEISRLVRVFVRGGVKKVRLTGGEPLLRRDIEKLVAQIAEIDGVEDIAMTTNGSLLTRERAQVLKNAGLQRVTVSLDSLKDDVFMKMNDVHFPVSKVLKAIDAAAEAGLTPVKVNMVVKRGLNDEDIVEMAQQFRGTGHILRFIEYMDVGNSNGWRMDDVVSAKDILNSIHEVWPLETVPPRHAGEVATRYRYQDGKGEIGVVSSVTRPFCGACNRSRLSAKGRLYTCLFASDGFDFRELLRSGKSDEEVFGALSELWGLRSDRYSELRSDETRRRNKIEMSQIGG
ncbi:GTP 3',8-cyclase MoaA [Alicyclobacillus sp. SO9]|uniref:GTP 3',8-cyclase MoaA n=1 Tax=Alicyclobacillus sp. SO9 TaxID=2665646 RepID=UPI0018E6DE0A|nr:GTP 3',8-cyclase MoaA [Alicyclobacillus sp. SO9]QQE77520.1 GTP 3',8-cyclase MoaA [Alicyclobacillus sp. SO9]